MSYVYKRPPCELYDVPAMESWLADMAANGLLFEKFGRVRARFVKATLAQLRYRLEPIAGEENTPSDEVMDVYGAAGWEYVTSLNGLFYIWRSTRIDAEELHTDPVVQSETYRRVCKKLTSEAVGSGVCVLGMLGIILCGFLFYPRPVALFLTSPMILLLAVAEIISVAQVILQAQSARRTKRILSDGIALEHRKNYRQGLLTRRIVNVVSLALSLSVLVISILTLTLDWQKDISEIDEPLPFLPLDVIEQDDALVWSEDPYIYRGINSENNVRFTWTPLVPVFYDFYQQASLQGRLWNDGSGAYEPSAQTEYYELAFSAFAPALLEELMEEHIWASDMVISELSHPDFERIVLATETDSAQLFAQHGNQVTYIQYQGYAPLGERLEELDTALDAAGR